MRETAWTMTLSSGPSVSKTSPATITCSTWLAAATSPIRSMASKRTSPSAARTSGSNRPKGLPSCQRSEEHTSELQSLMRISYAVFCLKKKKTQNIEPERQHTHRIISRNHYHINVVAEIHRDT